MSLWEQESFRNGTLLEIVGSSALVLYGMWVGIKIWKGSPRGREIAQRFLLIRLILCIAIHVTVFGFMLASDLHSNTSAAIREVTVQSIVRAIVFFVIWWAYFKSSKRVEHTYGPQKA